MNVEMGGTYTQISTQKKPIMKIIGSCTSHLEMLQILPCEMLKGNTMQQNFSITKRTQNMRGKQLTRY